MPIGSDGGTSTRFDEPFTRSSPPAQSRLGHAAVGRAPLRSVRWIAGAGRHDRRDRTLVRRARRAPPHRTVERRSVPRRLDPGAAVARRRLPPARPERARSGELDAGREPARRAVRPRHRCSSRGWCRTGSDGARRSPAPSRSTAANSPCSSSGRRFPALVFGQWSTRSRPCCSASACSRSSTSGRHTASARCCAGAPSAGRASSPASARSSPGRCRCCCCSRRSCSSTPRCGRSPAPSTALPYVLVILIFFGLGATFVLTRVPGYIRQENRFASWAEIRGTSPTPRRKRVALPDRRARRRPAGHAAAVQHRPDRHLRAGAADHVRRRRARPRSSSSSASSPSPPTPSPAGPVSPIRTSGSSSR